MHSLSKLLRRRGARVSYGATCCLERIVRSAVPRRGYRATQIMSIDSTYHASRCLFASRASIPSADRVLRERARPGVTTEWVEHRTRHAPFAQGKGDGNPPKHRPHEAPYLATHFCTSDALQNCHASDCSQTHVAASRVARHVVSRQPRLPPRPWHPSVPSTADVPTARGPDAAPVACGTPHSSCCCRCCCCCCRKRCCYRGTRRETRRAHLGRESRKTSPPS